MVSIGEWSTFVHVHRLRSYVPGTLCTNVPYSVPYSKQDATPLKALRQTVSLVALVLALAHLIWPSLAIDAITLALIVIAILPWLAPSRRAKARSLIYWFDDT